MHNGCRHAGARGKGASPESITTIGGMDSGPAPSGASKMCNCTSEKDERKWMSLTLMIPRAVVDRTKRPQGRRLRQRRFARAFFYPGRLQGGDEIGGPALGGAGAELCPQ